MGGRPGRPPGSAAPGGTAPGTGAPGGIIPTGKAPGRGIPGIAGGAKRPGIGGGAKPGRAMGAMGGGKRPGGIARPAFFICSMWNFLRCSLISSGMDVLGCLGCSLPTRIDSMMSPRRIVMPSSRTATRSTASSSPSPSSLSSASFCSSLALLSRRSMALRSTKFMWRSKAKRIPVTTRPSQSVTASSWFTYWIRRLRCFWPGILGAQRVCRRRASPALRAPSTADQLIDESGQLMGGCEALSFASSL
eukprot:scaffold343_cov245-Pinguiococcus_pyrenoidosus.AAC.25